MTVVRSAPIAVGWACALLLAGCGAAATQVDPQQPAPPTAKGQPLRPSQIVICPDGASYDTVRNTCVATTAIAPAAPRGEPAAPSRPDSSVSVRCSFNNGWVSVLPAASYPSDDTFLMQALIGFSQEPEFWASQSEYAELERYAARRCSERMQRFEVPAGDYFVLVGESGTFGRRGGYDRNGYRRRIRVSSGSPEVLSLRPSDLTITWSCISCPFVSFIDTASGRLLPAFVVLAWRNSAARKGTDRVLVEKVPVRDGKLRLRVAEAEPEVSQLDQLVLEVNGQVLLPRKGGAHSALAAADGVVVEMKQGTQIVVEYEVPWMTDGALDVQVVAHGYYDPT
jgi:hypothetical protein